MPDQEYDITVRDRRGVYARPPIQRVKLPEGESRELIFHLRKRKPLVVGEPAPPFTVQTTDRQTRSLAALRGKVVLLHFWNTNLSAADATPLRAVHDRFGNDARFAMIGLSIATEADLAAQVIRASGLSWPQAVLRDHSFDPIVVDYGAFEPHTTSLIGPDGKLLAQGLKGDAIEKAVADALARP